MLRSGLWHSVLGISLALGVLWSPRARAETAAERSESAVPSSPLALAWVSPDPSCDGKAVAARALELLPRGVNPAPLSARAELSRSGNDWVVELTTHGENTAGRRVLRGSSCQEIQQAIALLLAMILEAEAKSAPPPAAPAPPSAPPLPPPSPAWQEPAPSTSEVPVPPPPAEEPERLGWLLRLEGHAGVGWQPGLSFGENGNPGLGLGFGGTGSTAWRGWELGISGAYWPTTTSQAFGGRASLEMSRAELGLLGCRVLWQGAGLGLAPCVGGGGSSVSWRSIGLDASKRETARFGVLNAYVDLRIRLSGWLFLLASPGLAWEKSESFVTGTDNCAMCVHATLFQAWALEPRLKLGVGASF